MAPAVAASKAANMPFGFAEFGVAGTKTVLPGRPAWLTSIGSYLTANGALFGTYFDTSGPKPSQQLTDAASIAAWKKVIATSDSSVAPPHPPSSLPTVSITSPGNDAKVKGVITIGVKASSNVSRVNIVWDSSKLIRNASTKGPYGWGSRWGTTKASNGKHTITVTVYNAAGESKSSTITVKIDN
jgi:hypothetical protein